MSSVGPALPAGGTALAEVLLNYAQRIEADLLGNILPFWRTWAMSRHRPGLVGALSNDFAEDTRAERGMLLAARVLWTFSATFIRYGNPRDRRMADVVYAELAAHFHDAAHGGFVWSIHPTGGPAQRRKQIYGQAFAIYALSEYHSATRHDGALTAAMAVFDLIETHARDVKHGGYLEAFDEAWAPVGDMRLSQVDLNEPKSQNTHLHLVEAYAALLRCRPDDRVRTSLASLLDVMLTRIVQPDGHLGLFFARDWMVRCPRVSYGHDIEASWLLMDAARALSDPALIARTRRVALQLATVTRDEGVDVDGGLYNEGQGGVPTNTNKEWWPQAEAVVGFLEAYEQSGDEGYLRAALRAWEFIDARLIDHACGEWFRGVTREGVVLDAEPKISFWKCPYHNSRAALQAVSRLRHLAKR